MIFSFWSPVKEEKTEEIDIDSKERLEEYSPQKVEKTTCDVCLKTFENKDDLTNHMRTSHKKLNKCVKCSESFFKASELFNHLKTHSKNGSRTIDGTKLSEGSNPSVFQCEHCGEYLKNRKAYTGHAKKHLGFKCQECSKFFGTQES